MYHLEMNQTVPSLSLLLSFVLDVDYAVIMV